MSHRPVGCARFMGRQLWKPSWQKLTAWWEAPPGGKCWLSKDVDGQADHWDQWHDWVECGITAQVPARLCMPEWQSWTGHLHFCCWQQIIINHASHYWTSFGLLFGIVADQQIIFIPIPKHIPNSNPNSSPIFASPISGVSSSQKLYLGISRSSWQKATRICTWIKYWSKSTIVVYIMRLAPLYHFILTLWRYINIIIIIIIIIMLTCYLLYGTHFSIMWTLTPY